jgi:hypothetical protein
LWQTISLVAYLESSDKATDLLKRPNYVALTHTLLVTA